MENTYSTENVALDFKLSSSLISQSPSDNNINTKSFHDKDEIFMVIHKTEIILLPKKSNKDSARAIYQCIYCDKKYPTLHRIKSHIRHHVRIFI